MKNPVALLGVIALSSVVARPAAGQETVVPVKVTMADKKTRRGLASLPIQIEARLIVAKTAYPLGLGGDTAEQFRKKLDDLTAAKEAISKYPPRPAIDAHFELKNVCKDANLNNISFDVEAPLKITLEGKGAANVSVPGPVTGPAPKNEFVQQGKTVKVPLWWQKENDPNSSKLRSYWTEPGQKAGAFLRSYWTEPGKYQFRARYVTNVMDVNGRANWEVTLESDRVEIVVK